MPKKIIEKPIPSKISQQIPKGATLVGIDSEAAPDLLFYYLKACLSQITEDEYIVQYNTSEHTGTLYQKLSRGGYKTIFATQKIDGNKFIHYTSENYTNSEFKKFLLEVVNTNLSQETIKTKVPNKPYLRDQIGSPELKGMLLRKIESLDFSSPAAFVQSHMELEEYQALGRSFHQVSSKTVPHLDSNTKPTDHLSQCLLQNNGVVVGLGHSEVNQATIAEITSGIGRLKASGLTHLCIELPYELKDVFDQFNRDGDLKALQENIEICNIEIPNPEFTKAIFKLCLAAKNENITIVPVDQKFPKADANRILIKRAYGGSDEVMAYNILNATKDESSKFLFVVGCAHCQVAEYTGVPMLAYLEKDSKAMKSILDETQQKSIEYGKEVKGIVAITHDVAKPFQADYVFEPPQSLRDKNAKDASELLGSGMQYAGCDIM